MRARPRDALSDARGVLHLRIGAKNHVARDAVFAGAAEDRQAPDHVIAGLEARDVRSDCLHDPGGLVAQNDRHRLRDRPVDIMQVGMAQPDRRRPDADLVRTHVAQRHVGDGERLSDLLEDRGLHRAHPAACVGLCMAVPPCLCAGAKPRQAVAGRKGVGVDPHAGGKALPMRQSIDRQVKWGKPPLKQGRRQECNSGTRWGS